MREYGVRNYDAEATHKDYLIGDISHIGATRLCRVLINEQIAAPLFLRGGRSSRLLFIRGH